MSPGERRRSNRDGHSRDRLARIGRRSRSLYFRTAVEDLEPRCMLSAQVISDIASPTFRLALANSSQGSATPATAGFTSPASNAYTPTEILNAYGFNQVTFSTGPGNGAGQTIAIIDAYQDPDIANDAATFSSYYGLVQFGSTNGPTLTITSQTGGSVSSVATDPSADDWALETSLDVEWAHALAPEANILLVEANSDNISDLMAAVKYATTVSNVSVVSMSWETPETQNVDSTYDSYFTTPGITFVASAGDSGSPGGYPAYSPNVLAVGGTSLTLSSGNYSSETVWNDSYGSTGGGISTHETEPAYQDAVVPLVDSNDAANRAMPDVAFDADPSSGVAIVDSYDYPPVNGVPAPWLPGTVGGTSFGTPAWAAIIAIADQGRAIDGLGSLSSSQTMSEIYDMPSTDFHDITTGSNGTYSAAPGYDLVTGRGTPLVSSVVGYLDQFSVIATTPAIGSTAYNVTTDPTSFTVTFSDAFSTAGLSASDFQVNGIAASSYTTNGTQITFTFATSPIIPSQSAQTMSIAAGAITRAADGSPLLAFSGTFNDDPLPQLTVSSITPTSGTTIVAPLTSVTVVFSEAYAASSISDSNLSLSRGTVTGFTRVNSTTVMYSLGGLTGAGPGSVIVTILAGAITDADGGAGVGFTATYFLSTGLIAGLPVGSLVYEVSDGGTIATSGAEPQYTLSVAAGETITAVVIPGTLTATTKLSLSGHGILQTATSSGSQDAVLQNVAVTSSNAGTFTFGIYSPGGGLGTFTLEVYLNAAVSTSSVGGASNNQFSSAQSLTPSLESTGPKASREAVVGVTDGLSNGLLSDYYSFTLAAGQTVTLAVADQSAATGTINVSLLNSSGAMLATGTPMTTNVDGAVENFTATTDGTYYAQVTGTKANIAYDLVVTLGADFDLKTNSLESTAQNITGTAGVLGAILSSAPTDWYAVNLAAGASLTLQSYTFGGTTANSENFVDSVQPQIQLYKSADTLLATGTGNTNQSLTDSVSTAGTYYIEVTGRNSSAGEYFLGVSTAVSVSITPISPNPTNAAVSQMQIVFNGPVSGMSLADLSLSLSGGPNLITGSQASLSTTDDKTFTLGNLGTLTGTNGVYTLTVAANSGITNQNGLSLQTGASSTFTVDTTPPDVTGVYVSGAAWTQTFLNYLASNNLGNSTLGYLIPAGANQLQVLPWVNITTISVVFNENVTVNTADSALQLLGSPNGPTLAALSSAAFTYSAATDTAQWTFSSPLPTDQYLLSIPSVDVTDLLGSTLSGAWTTSSSAYPSGNGTAGSSFNFQFNILRGNASQNGTVSITGQDGTEVRSLLLQNTTTGSYSPFYDLVGSGTITGLDGSYIRICSGSTLPGTAPSVAVDASGDATIAADPSSTGAALASGSSANSGSTGDASASTSESATPVALVIGNPSGAGSLFIGAPPSGLIGDSSAVTALKLVSVTPVSAGPSKAPQEVESTSVAENSVQNPTTLAMPVDPVPLQTVAAPIRLSLEVDATISTENTGVPQSTSHAAIDTFSSSAAMHGDGLLGDSNGDDRNDRNDGDELPPQDWLADLVLEVELDWLGG